MGSPLGYHTVLLLHGSSRKQDLFPGHHRGFIASSRGALSQRRFEEREISQKKERKNMEEGGGQVDSSVQCGGEFAVFCESEY
jgi:hypothetical protein